MLTEFLAAKSARSLAGEIEAYALAQGHVSALLVPWESTPTTLAMAVTAVRGEGWAIEHTNLGTVTLTDLGGASTRVVVAGADVESTLATVFERFAKQLQARFATSDSAETSDPRTGRGGQRSL
ncbi:MAG TPA: hypothetical protein VKH42_11360 [Vicinamibacterales bacterium]|nr:hypothetical protein [Vicinamibacterales bacterium]